MVPLLLALVHAGCAPTPCASETRASLEVNQKVQKLMREIDELAARYDALQKENAAIERLLSQLGFSVTMDSATVADRVALMHRFERAKAGRTRAFHKVREQLRVITSRHGTETTIRVEAGHIVVRIAESALFDTKTGALRPEATPLLWAVADSLKEFEGRRFEVLSQTAAPQPQTKEPKQRSARAKRRQQKQPPLKTASDPWHEAMLRSLAVVQAFHAAGLGWERLVAGVRAPASLTGGSDTPSIPGGADTRADKATAPRDRATPPVGSPARFIEILVLPTGEELPRVHGVSAEVRQ